jgi:hypothetical protein
MYISDKISLQGALASGAEDSTDPLTISDKDFVRLIKDVREFLLTARHLERKV